MLVRYKKANEKIAMGFLSYIPGEKMVKKLQETILQYETDDKWELYLAKKDEDFIGLVGLEVDEDTYTVQHISVNPSFRGEGIGKEIIQQIRELYPKKKCNGTEFTAPFLTKCTEEGLD